MHPPETADSGKHHRPTARAGKYSDFPTQKQPGKRRKTERSGYELLVTKYELLVTKYELLVTKYELLVTSHFLAGFVIY